MDFHYSRPSSFSMKGKEKEWIMWLHLNLHVFFVRFKISSFYTNHLKTTCAFVLQTNVQDSPNRKPENRHFLWPTSIHKLRKSQSFAHRILGQYVQSHFHRSRCQYQLTNPFLYLLLRERYAASQILYSKYFRHCVQDFMAYL